MQRTRALWAVLRPSNFPLPVTHATGTEFFRGGDFLTFFFDGGGVFATGAGPPQTSGETSSDGGGELCAGHSRGQNGGWRAASCSILERVFHNQKRISKASKPALFT